jgi:competence protein ComQ
VLIAGEAGRIIQESLNGAGLPAPFINLIIQPLSLPGKILSGTKTFGWSELVKTACDASNGNVFAAARVAAAVETLAAALDVLDDIEDGDQSALLDLAGLPQTLNVSTALLFLSQLILSELHIDGVAPKSISDFTHTMSRLGLIATGGQHNDLSINARSEISLSEALQITIDKSGSLAACACRLGALLGTSEPELLNLYESFGRHYGTMIQLSNDLHDAQDSVTKTDLQQLKPTLPILFYVRRKGNAKVEELHPDELAGSGALHFTWVVFESQRQRCFAILEELEGRNQSTAQFRLLLEQHAAQRQPVDD